MTDSLHSLHSGCICTLGTLLNLSASAQIWGLVQKKNNNIHLKNKRPSLSMKLCHFISNRYLIASVSWLMHSQLSVSCQSELFPALFWSYHLVVMTKLWLDLRVRRFHLSSVLFNTTPSNPSSTATSTPAPSTQTHIQHNGCLPPLTLLLLKNRVVVLSPWKHHTWMCVCVHAYLVNVSLSLSLWY